MYDKITIMIDIDDCIWDLVENWITTYKKRRAQSYKYAILDDEHDKSLNKSMVTSWDIEERLNPSNKKLFWDVLADDIFWQNITVSPTIKTALNTLNAHKNIDLIICTDTHYKTATAKLNRFFELFPFIKPSQIICMKEKWRLDADIVIDDKPETLEKFMLKQNPPFAVIKILQPWNTTTICDYTWNEFNDGLVRFCINAAEAYADTIREIKKEQEDNEFYERCYYN